MSTELLLAAVGSGKTGYALSQLVDIAGQEPFGQIWVLLASSRQEDAFRQRLVDYSGEKSVFFNITFFNFYSLYSRLLDMVGAPQRELDATARVRLIRNLMINLRDEGRLEVFNAIADKPGFARVMADFIYELKQNIVRPDEFLSAAANAKDRDLAAIFSAYQSTLLHHQLVDREGEGWLALEKTNELGHIGQNVRYLLIDGFDQFNPLQSQLVALLAGRAQQTLITLPVVAGRESTVGRRFSEARARLEAEFQKRGQVFHLTRLDALPHSTRSSELHHLTTHFGLQTTAPIPTADGCLTLLEAPQPKDEAAAVMRRVKRHLIDGCAPDDILIAVRDWERYGYYLASAAQQYNVPAVMHYGQSLSTNPAVIALLTLLELARNNFRQREVLDVLRSPYFFIEGFERDRVDLLDRISHAQRIVSGAAEWLEGIHLAAHPTIDEYGETQAALITDGEADHLAQKLEIFFKAVTPPERASEITYVRWLEDLIGADPQQAQDDDAQTELEQPYSLHLLSGVRTVVGGRAIVARDMIALHEFTRVLRGLLATQRLFATLNIKVTNETTWNSFLHDLKSSVSRAAADRSPNRAGKVLVTSVADARGLPHKHILIPGLSEGIFPLPTPEDPLYLDSERERLTRNGILLETQAERAADDGLFYGLISQAQETLTLTRPTVQNGAPWPESHLWRAVKVLFADSNNIIEQNRIRLGSTVKPEDAASRNEAALAVTDALSRGIPESNAAKVYNHLLRIDRERWQHVIHARDTEQQRMLGRSFNAYSGWLTQPHLVEWVARELGDRHIWSASQFNDYGMCGFRFFAKRLLKLEEIEELEEGMDARQLGTLNHAILEETYRRLAGMNIVITPEFAERAVAELMAVAAAIFRDAPRRYGFRESALWPQEQKILLRKLEAAVRLDFSDESPIKAFAADLPRQPYQQEVPFADETGHVLTLPLGGDDALRVTGFIDRMDRIGDRVVVVDYKTGSTRIPVREMEEGRNFQMMLYLLAGQAILERDSSIDKPTDVAGGVFWHLRDGRTSGEIHTGSDEGQAAIKSAQQHLERHLTRGRVGQFAVQPAKGGNNACSHYCEFTHLCRVSIMNRQRKAD